MAAAPGQECAAVAIGAPVPRVTLCTPFAHPHPPAPTATTGALPVLTWGSVLPAWLALLRQYLALSPFSRLNPAGVRDCLELTATLLRERGFTVVHHPNPSPDGAGVLIASRAPRGGNPHTIGLFAHVDVENVRPSQVSAWKSASPLLPELLADGRYYCRGIADNLGPFLARVLAFSASDAHSAGIVWVIQGEEETGSEFAHSLLPGLKVSTPELGSVMLWIEETGYFTEDGTQRVLCMHAQLSQAADPAQLPSSHFPVVQSALAALASQAGSRKIIVQERYLNKSFGSNRCPCLAHLLDGNVPYLSFGINDVLSCIHAVDESVPASILDVAFEQFKAVVAVQ
jgi:acetylornithine deacetylase/succinyl-diaminopimelate desuccinylase-like protein